VHGARRAAFAQPVRALAVVGQDHCRPKERPISRDQANNNIIIIIIIIIVVIIDNNVIIINEKKNKSNKNNAYTK
jgi:hypothetical protein